MFRIVSRKRRIELRRFAHPIGSAVATLLVSSPAFAQFGGDRVTSFLSNALSYAQGLGIFASGFLVIWAVANIARERPSGEHCRDARDCQRAPAQRVPTPCRWQRPPPPPARIHAHSGRVQHARTVARRSLRSALMEASAARI